jgi:DNA-binding XRE family transcriptional regulator
MTAQRVSTMLTQRLLWTLNRAIARLEYRECSLPRLTSAGQAKGGRRYIKEMRTKGPRRDEARDRAAFAERLSRLLAERQDLTRAALARKARLSESEIYALADGRRSPNLTTLLALRQGLSLGSIEELLGPLPSHTFPPREAG